VGLSPRLERPLLRLVRRRPAERPRRQVRERRGRLRHRDADRALRDQRRCTGRAAVPRALHSRHAPHASVRGGLPGQSDQTPDVHDDAHALRPIPQRGDGGRGALPLEWPVPLRRARRGCRQRDERQHLGARRHPPQISQLTSAPNLYYPKGYHPQLLPEWPVTTDLVVPLTALPPKMLDSMGEAWRKKQENLEVLKKEGVQ